MKERPILFSAPMVRAILDGRKTQTRRLVKGVEFGRDLTSKDILAYRNGHLETVNHWLHGRPVVVQYTEISCPYGQPGDRLYVRESYYQFGHWEEVEGVRTKKGRQKWRFVADHSEICFGEPAHATVRKGRHHKDPYTPAWHKRLARFMPRAASRILLEIESIRIERLNDISEADAKAEGCSAMLHRRDSVRIGAVGNCRNHFEHLWNSINGPGSWDDNPWVWVVEFKRAGK